MRRYSKKEVEDMLASFKRGGYPVKKFLGMYYHIIPAEQAPPDLLHFVMFMSSAQTVKYVIGVSSAIPEKFQKFFAYHEFIELTTLCSCEEATKEELETAEEHLTPEEFAEYKTCRHKFFSDLIPFCAGQPDHYTAQDLAGFAKSKALFA